MPAPGGPSSGKDMPMPLRFATLASGSKGNCALVERDGRVLMIDIGLSPRALMGRLARIGLSLADIGEIVLTHTHGDHVNDKSLALMASKNVVFRCHPDHEAALAHKEGFGMLKAQGQVRHFEAAPFCSSTGLGIHPVPVRHGAGRTFGFRINPGSLDRSENACIGYVADLGCWNERTAVHFRNCRLLAVEFNHDVEMTRKSDRHYMVKMRNLSNDGHLSNIQAAELVRAILDRSDFARPEHLVLLHISEDCNTEELALQAAARAVRQGQSTLTAVRAAPQREPLPWLEVTPATAFPPLPESSDHGTGEQAAAAVQIQQEFRFSV